MNKAHILLVEDNEGDILLTKEAFEERQIINKISIARDGEDAINFLELIDKSEIKNYPDIILLDINLPKKNGHEVLKFIKNSDKFKHIPVLVLTTSSSEKDVREAYNNHVNSYITKPTTMTDFIDAISKIEDFWIGIVQLPRKQN